MSASSRIISWVSGCALAAMVVGCGAKGNKPNVELIQDLMESPALKAQDFKNEDREASSQLLPPAGTVARDAAPYPYAADPVGAEAKLRNPLAGDMSEGVLAVGQKKYEIYCAVCHGETGKGDGPVAPKMALKPPSLMTDKIRNYKDGRVYHIITAGQGVMGQYAGQIYNERDRWAIVNYIRKMQSKTPADNSAQALQGSGG